MTQTLLVVVLFVGAMATLPWLVRRLQQRHASSGLAVGAPSKVVSAVAVGPQQKVVTVEVGPDHARTCLVLGVTPQQITCLHVLPISAGTPPSAGTAAVPSFEKEMALAGHSAQKAGHA